MLLEETLMLLHKKSCICCMEEAGALELAVVNIEVFSIVVNSKTSHELWTSLEQ